MKPELMTELNKIREEFIISNITLSKISEDFYNDMFEKHMLKMLKTYVNTTSDKVLPNEYLSIDIGGSNVRISKLKISEDNILIEKMIKLPLRTKLYDYTKSKYTLKYLFVMALKKIIPFLDKEKMYTLAVTVSFGLDSKSKTEATIIELSKGFELSETLGENIYQILSEAIKEVGLKIIPTAIINDCVATMVTGKFYNPNADISFIVGTGHNACFIDSSKEIINIESANFNKNLPLTQFDKKFISKIPKESGQLLEVLIGGKYICKIAEVIIKSCAGKGLIKDFKDISTEDLIKSLNGEAIIKYSAEQKAFLKEVAKLLFERSARLVVAEILAILRYIDPELNTNHTIIFDGSVYEKCEFFKEEISRVLESVLLEKSKQISHKLIKDASSIGPAIVSASVLN